MHSDYSDGPATTASSASPIILTPPSGGWSNLDVPEHLRAITPDLDPSFSTYSYPAKEKNSAWPVPAPAAPCLRTWKVLVCECRVKVYQGGCSSLDCTACESHLMFRRAASFRARFESVRGERPVLYTILTVPVELRTTAADVKIWTAWRRAIWKYLKKNCGGRFAVERTDPAGDSDPTLWHPHLNLLWIQRDGFRPFLDLDALRAEWKRIIKAPGPVNLHHHYSDNPRKIGAWYWYMARPWPDWQGSVKKHMTVRWLGSYPKKEPKETACSDCGRRFISKDLGTREAAEEFAALGPEGCLAEIRRIRREAFEAKNGRGTRWDGGHE